jgi:hypothetical protein
MAHCLAMGKRGPEAWAESRGLVSEQGRSGQGVTAFCQERGRRLRRVARYERGADASHKDTDKSAAK